MKVKALIDGGSSLKRVAEEAFGTFVRHEKSLISYKRLTTKPRDFKSIVILFVGPSGVGKSRMMRLFASELGSSYVAPLPKGSGAYFDGYGGEDVLILDEFSGASMTPTFFNTLCDRYECTLPVHGAAGHQMVSKYILIGSNYLPHMWWKERRGDQIRQTKRRIDVCVYLSMHERLKEINKEKSAPAQRAPLAAAHSEYCLCRLCWKKTMSARRRGNSPDSKAATAVPVGNMTTYVEFLNKQGILY